MSRANNLIVDLVLTRAKAYMNNETVDCSLAVDDGKISRIGKETSMPKSDVRNDLSGLLVLPGLIDAHVHLRDEGKAYKEDFFSGTAAAAAGGFTTVLDMPNNKPVTMSAETMKRRMTAAKNKILVDVGFFSEFPDNLSEMTKIVEEGAIAFKLYMTEQVGGLNIDDDAALHEAFRAIRKLGRLVCVHSEDRESLDSAVTKLKEAGHNDIDAYLKAHSEEVEVRAIERVLKIAGETNAQVHFCHVSTESGLEAICNRKRLADCVTCEVTPHNLCLSANDLRKTGTLGLTMPPVRTKRHMVALWKGVKNGCVDIVASDHAPHTLEEKKAGSVWDVKAGIPGLETTLLLLLNEVKRQRLSIGDIVRLMAETPAQLFRLSGKGALKKGNNADLTVVDMKKRCRIDASKFHSKAKFSPFNGWRVEGKPVRTYVKGRLVMDEGQIVGRPGSGGIVRSE
jgi:dihydroorotase